MYGTISITALFSVVTTLVVLCGLEVAAEGQYESTRCQCICPDPHIVFNNITTTKRIIYQPKPGFARSECTCDGVVVPIVRDIINGKEGEYCPWCQCKFEHRNTTIIRVVIFIVIWIVSVLMIYMMFLMCLDPLLNKRIKNTSTYTEHQDEDDESVGPSSGGGGGRTAHQVRMTSAAGDPSSVLNRVGRQQSKWKNQVQEQRRNIYDRHTMLN
jgi:hypothetical protein